MTTVRDEDFLNPTQINSIPCYASDRMLKKVDESVLVTQVCQDSIDTSLVIIDFVLIGAFYFTPYCRILRVDNDITYENEQVFAPLALGNFRNPEIPINTNCNTFYGQIVFDFGEVIPNFNSAIEIEFELGMIGQIPQAYGVSFPNQTPTHTYVWQKNVLPVPISVSYFNGSYNVTFEYNGRLDCSCAVQCVIPSGVTQNIQFCPDQRQTVNIYYGDLSQDPTTMLIQLRDGIGNLSQLEVTPLVGVKPASPIVTLQDNPRAAFIAAYPNSIGGQFLEDIQYQIIKYYGTQNNYVVWRDWSSKFNSAIVDTELLPNKTYGYATRFKGKFGEVSNLSDYFIINT